MFNSDLTVTSPKVSGIDRKNLSEKNMVTDIVKSWGNLELFLFSGFNPQTLKRNGGNLEVKSRNSCILILKKQEKLGTLWVNTLVL